MKKLALVVAVGLLGLALAVDPAYAHRGGGGGGGGRGGVSGGRGFSGGRGDHGGKNRSGSRTGKSTKAGKARVVKSTGRANAGWKKGIPSRLQNKALSKSYKGFSKQKWNGRFRCRMWW